MNGNNSGKDNKSNGKTSNSKISNDIVKIDGIYLNNEDVADDGLE